MTNAVRRWAAAAGLAGGAAIAAAMIGASGMPAARADDGSLATDIGLLTTAETDVSDGLTALSQLPGVGGTIPPELGELTSQFEAIQTPLLSSDNSVLSGLGELLFNGPDQQLAQSAETFLSAVDAFAADPTSPINAFDAVSAAFGYDGSLLFDSVPANAIGKLVDQVAGFDIGSAGAAADAASSASGTTPDEVVGQTITDLNQGTALLDTASTADLGTRAADLLSGQEGLPAHLDPVLAQFASLQDELSPGDQALVADVDQLMVSAAQNILTADQGLVAADQAGELGGSSLNASELTLIGADLNFLGAFLDADGASLIAVLTGGFDPSSVADFASLDPATVVDPSVFADMLSAIGF